MFFNLLKMNPYHDERGRFSTANGSTEADRVAARAENRAYADFSKRTSGEPYQYVGFNRFELPMTQREIDSVPPTGRADEAVAALAADPSMRKRLDAIPHEKIQAELKDYGAWSDLSNKEANYKRLLWVAAGNAQEEARMQKMDITALLKRKDDIAYGDLAMSAAVKPPDQGMKGVMGQKKKRDPNAQCMDMACDMQKSLDAPGVFREPSPRPAPRNPIGESGLPGFTEHSPLEEGAGFPFLSEIGDAFDPLVRKYSPDQPRDKDGKWVDGNAVNAQSGIKHSYHAVMYKPGSFGVAIHQRQPGKSYDTAVGRFRAEWPTMDKAKEVADLMNSLTINKKAGAFRVSGVGGSILYY